MACATFLYRDFCFSSSHDFNDHNFCRMFFLFSMTIANQRYLNGNSWIKKKWAIQDKGKTFRETWSNRQSFGQRQTAEKWYMKTKVDWKHCQATLLLHNRTTKAWPTFSAFTVQKVWSNQNITFTDWNCFSVFPSKSLPLHSRIFQVNLI